MKPNLTTTLAAVAIATVGIVGLSKTAPATQRSTPCACPQSEPTVIEPVVIERHFAEPPPPPTPEPEPLVPAHRPLPVTSD